MKAEDRRGFVEVVLGFAELKGKQLSAPALELYWRALQHWDIADFRAAAEQLLRSSEFMPTPKDFEDLRKAGRATVGEAWTKAVRNASSAIVCGQVTAGATCGDPLIDRAVRAIGGYGVLAMCPSDKLCFLEQRFAEHYAAIEDAEEVREALPQLTSTLRIAGPKKASDLLSRLPRPDA